MDNLQKERFSGFSEHYDRFRPATPIAKLRSILGKYGPVDRIMMANIGCGTGLSTFAWAPYAQEIYGIEPNPDMIKPPSAIGRTGPL